MASLTPASLRSFVDELVAVVGSTLRKELGVSVRIYDTVTGKRLDHDAHESDPEADLSNAAEVWNVVAHGNVSVETVKPGELQVRPFERKRKPRKPPILATGILRRHRPELADSPRERPG